MRTVPVNQSAGPLVDGCEPILLISIYATLLCLGTSVALYLASLVVILLETAEQEICQQGLSGRIEPLTDDDLRSLISENRAQAVKEGWTERSVASAVKKHRQEKSRH